MRAKDKILEEAAAGRLGFVEAVAELAAASGAVAELKEAKIDHARHSRCGFPEFVYGAGKSLEQLLEIYRIFHRQFSCEWFQESHDNHFCCLCFRESPAHEIEQFFF